MLQIDRFVLNRPPFALLLVGLLIPAVSGGCASSALTVKKENSEAMAPAVAEVDESNPEETPVVEGAPLVEEAPVVEEASKAPEGSGKAAAGKAFACQYSMSFWNLAPGEFRVHSGGPVFAENIWRVSMVRNHVTLPFGEASQGVMLAFSAASNGWSLQGPRDQVEFTVNYVPKKPLTLYTRIPLELSPVLTWSQGSSVLWEPGDGERLKVRIERPRELRGKDIHTTIACEDTTLRQAEISFPDEASLTQPIRMVALPAGVEAELAEEPGAPPIEHLFSKTGKILLHVLEERDGFVKIRKYLQSGRVVGWTRSASLKEHVTPHTSGPFAYGLSGKGIGGGGTVRIPEYERCQTEVPFFVRLKGKLYPIGTLRKNAAVVLGKKNKEHVEFTLPELEWLKLTPKAALVLRPTDADICLNK